MARKATVVRTETTTDDQDGHEDELAKHLDVALFTNLGDTEDTTIDKVHVLRTEPDEGYLGYLEATATEYDVFQRWGGSKYALEAKNERGRIITRRTLKLAGDPVFMSEVFDARWRKQNGLKPKKFGDSDTPTDGAYSAKELMAIIEAKSEAARVEAETREEKRRREDAEREEKARRDEREWRERMEKDKAEREARSRTEEREHRERLEAQRREDDKRREDQRREEDRQREARMREDEQRREKEHERQMSQAAAAAKESQEKSQQFFTNMLAMAKAGDKGASTMEQVTQVLTLVEALKSSGSGEPQDAVTALLARLPETLQAAGSMVGGAIREAKGLPPQQQQGGDEGDEGGQQAGASNDGSIRLTGAAAAKVRELVTHLIQKGQDPEKVLVAAMDYLMGKRQPAPSGASRAVAAGKEKAVQAAKAKHPSRKAKHARARKPNPAPAPAPKAAPGPTVAKPAGAP